MHRRTKNKNDMEKIKIKKEKLVFIRDEKEKAPRFHYDGYHVLDEGKTVEIFVSTPDNQLGKIVLPWEEIDRIRKCGWEFQEKVAEEEMKGKRVHCRHLKSWHSLFPACCQIGKDAGPQYVNYLTCKYIDGYIEEYDPDKECEKVVIPQEKLCIMNDNVHVEDSIQNEQ